MRASILINNYNYAAYLGEAIDSALAQDWDDVEVIVVDDGSTDGSAAVLDAYEDRVVVVRKPNGGQASAFNAGFEHATGSIVFLLDADDLFLPGKVRAVLEALEEARELEWCFHPLAYQGGEGPEQRGATGVVDARATMRQGRAPGVLASATTGLAFRRTLLDEILPMPEAIRITADNYLKAVALSLAPGRVLDERLAVQRIHGANLYTGADADDPRRAAVELQIAAALRERWPHLRRYAVARGIGAVRMAGGEVPVDGFLQHCNTLERCRVGIHRGVWRYRAWRR